MRYTGDTRRDLLLYNELSLPQIRQCFLSCFQCTRGVHLPHVFLGGIVYRRGLRQLSWRGEIGLMDTHELN